MTTVTTISTTQFLHDIIILIRDRLEADITDPIAATRDSKQDFVMTAFPSLSVTYPVIIVVDNGIQNSHQAMQSEIEVVRVGVQVRIWARTQPEKDDLTAKVYNSLRTFQYESSPTVSSVNAGLFDFELLSMTNDDVRGDGGYKGKMMEFAYSYVIGQ